jgi:hypothetical protein
VNYVTLLVSKFDRKFSSLEELKAKLAEDPTYFTRLAGLENLKRTSPYGFGRSLELAWTRLHPNHAQRDLHRGRRDLHLGRRGLRFSPPEHYHTTTNLHDDRRGLHRGRRDLVGKSGEFYILEQPPILKKARIRPKVKKPADVERLSAAVAVAELPSPLTPPSALFSGQKSARYKKEPHILLTSLPRKNHNTLNINLPF